ncbi:GNAT family N-acetyltransferase [Iamia sp. SCSIO 61187]|uniref:GNAT family N-acetyltransferase n=1 Tax=Iamia sp. SCSIO 61187 TaxID=2722752 RepID=UPI001C63233D|nr:GNAT family N-acetyltransferase [Iamia sp. SCSIO 61187]QYG92318.1 GNAT family N-acetyltransferase [Iamia sp. SCSIO 61187]
MLAPATADDEPFLWEMLAQAAFPDGGQHPPELLADDHLRRYLDGWGRAGDVGLVAWEDGRRMGASWLRLMTPERPGYGFVDAATPEVSVAVVDGAWGRGLGRSLMLGALDLAAAHGHARVSLSVALTNVRAAGLYLSLGFVAVGPDGEGSMTMVAPSAPAPPPGPDDAGAGPPTARPATVDDGPALARLRQVMFAGMDVVDEGDWVLPFVAMWPGERAAGRWSGAVVPGPDGRAVASALAVTYPSPPGPGRPDGRVAHVGSVATDPAWRRRGAARAAMALLLSHLDQAGVQSSTLNASPAGSGLYLDLGFRVGRGQAMRRPHP